MASVKMIAVLAVVTLAIFIQDSEAIIPHRRHVRICKILSQEGEILKEKRCRSDEQCTDGPKEYSFENRNGTETTVSAFQCQITEQPDTKVANTEEEDPRVQERLDRMAQAQVKRFLHVRKGFDHKNRRVHDSHTPTDMKRGFKAFGRAGELKRKMANKMKQ